LKSPVYADEVVTDVFVKIWTNRKKLMMVQNIEAYLFTITKRESLNYIRNHRLNSHTFLQLNQDLRLMNSDPEQEMISREIIDVIESAINELPEKCKLVFRMVKENGMKYREVAQLLEISEKAVEMHMGKAFKRIKYSLDRYENIHPSHEIHKVILRLLPILLIP
jgi:RNA polymerase sigma-70 factor (ECF subfamily)